MEAEKKHISALETGEKKHSMFLPGRQTLICIKTTQCFTNAGHVPTLCKSKTNCLVDISAIEAQSRLLEGTNNKSHLTLTCR